jgi:hypothetical protein
LLPATRCSGILLPATGCSGILLPATGCSGILLPATGCSGILLKLTCTSSCVVNGMNRISWLNLPTEIQRINHAHTPPPPNYLLRWPRSPHLQNPRLQHVLSYNALQVI